MKRLLLLLLLSLTLQACVSLPQKESFVYEEIQTSEFDIASWAKVEKESPFLRIYIEGDGFAWRTPYRPSYNPTPLTTLILDLAEEDTQNNVVYLARPCQYIFSSQCEVYFWTLGRFDKKIIQAEEEAVKFLIEKYHAQEVQLVGYSGGATVALLVALKIPEVTSVVTLAGVLNHSAWTSYHRDSPLEGSLNPVEEKERLASLRQIHYVGQNDKTVPFVLTQEYISSLGQEHNSKMEIIPNVTHEKGWAKAWSELLQELEQENKSHDSQALNQKSL